MISERGIGAAARMLAGAAAFGGLGAPGGCARGEFPPARNAIVVVIDTCRDDAIGADTRNGPVTPALEHFARTATRFRRASAPAPWTLPSMTSLLTGVEPSVHGAAAHYPNPAFRRLREEVPTAAEILRAAGFRTGAFVNCAFLAPSLGLGRGFEAYDFQIASRQNLRTAPETLRAALAWLRSGTGERFFLLVHLFEPHMDYDPPEPERSRFLRGVAHPLEPPFEKVRDWRDRPAPPDVQRFARALYLAEVAAVDRALGTFFASLDSLGLSRETLVVVTADHGEELWDHGGFEHGHSLHEEVLRVPLLLRVPGMSGPRAIEARVGLVDLLPTLLELLGVEGRAPFQGRSLVPLLEGRRGEQRALFAESLFYGEEEQAITQGRYKLIVGAASGEQHLFDLAADPQERHDLAQERPAIAARLALRLAQHHRENLARAGGRASNPSTIDIRTVETLRSLGYVR